MSQHDYNIANGGGAAVRADINNAMLAILSQNSGATAPTTTKPFMFWYDTANGVLKMRNPADTAWLTVTDTAGAFLAAVADGSITALKLASNAVTTAKILDANITTAKIADANVTPAKLSQKITQGTAVATTSGTAIDFTGIPSWAKRITVMFAGVSVSGASNILVQLGAGSVTTTGYLGGAWAANTINTSITTGLAVTGTNEAARRINGLMTIANVSGNTWASSVVTFDNINNNGGNGGSYIALGGTLDRIRLTTVNGTDTFDAGSVNILYEG